MQYRDSTVHSINTRAKGGEILNERRHLVVAWVFRIAHTIISVSYYGLC